MKKKKKRERHEVKGKRNGGDYFRFTLLFVDKLFQWRPTFSFSLRGKNGLMFWELIISLYYMRRKKKTNMIEARLKEMPSFMVNEKHSFKNTIMSSLRA